MSINLLSKTIYIIREAFNKFKNLAILWSGGKDSTILIHLAKIALPESEFNKIHIITLDTNFMYPETRNYIEIIKRTWNLKKHRYSKLIHGVNPKDGIYECCYVNKTQNLRNIIKNLGLDGIIVGIRRDEQEIRNKERFFSPRDNEGRWDIWNQPCELQGWDIYATEYEIDKMHVRVHPLLEWTELDVWQYIKNQNILVNPLYFAYNNKRMRSIGCLEPCSNFIESNAISINAIICDILDRKGTEREGRHTEKEKTLMQKLRALGYF